MLNRKETMGDGGEIDDRGRILGHPKRVRASIVVPRRKLLLRIFDATGALVISNDIPAFTPLYVSKLKRIPHDRAVAVSSTAEPANSGDGR